MTPPNTPTKVSGNLTPLVAPSTVDLSPNLEELLEAPLWHSDSGSSPYVPKILFPGNLQESNGSEDNSNEDEVIFIKEVIKLE